MEAPNEQLLLLLLDHWSWNQEGERNNGNEGHLQADISQTE